MFLTKVNKINVYFWILYAIYAIFTLEILGFGVYFLHNLGFAYVEIGLAIGISALVSTIVQPLIGRIADIRQYSWKNILIVLSILMIISSLGIFVVPNYLIIFLFSLIVITTGCIYPFLNTAVFYYENYGIEILTNRGMRQLVQDIFQTHLKLAE